MSARQVPVAGWQPSPLDKISMFATAANHHLLDQRLRLNIAWLSLWLIQ